MTFCATLVRDYTTRRISCGCLCVQRIILTYSIKSINTILDVSSDKEKCLIITVCPPSQALQEWKCCSINSALCSGSWQECGGAIKMVVVIVVTADFKSLLKHKQQGASWLIISKGFGKKTRFLNLISNRPGLHKI